MNNLSNYGFSEPFISYANEYPDLKPARVTAQHREVYRLMTKTGEATGKVSGKYRFDAHEPTDYPTVGDFVMIAPQPGDAVIHRLLPRRSLFVRKSAGGGDAQLVAANINTVFIAMALVEDFNIRRLERYLAISYDSMAKPVVLLTKSDLCDDLDHKLREVESVAFGADVLVTSASTADGYTSLLPYVAAGQTVAFIGSSGVGKSTLINRLMAADQLATSQVRADGRGRHTTTHRELYLLPGGGMVIDTPGMRELGVLSADFTQSFADIDELARDCQFGDCTHRSEPGCAVRAAIASGDLSEERLMNFHKLRREARYEGLTSKQIEEAKWEHMVGGKASYKQIRDMLKDKNRQKGR